MSVAPQCTEFDHYTVDNSPIIGTWYISKDKTITLNADGTTDFEGATTYEYIPLQGTLIFYNEEEYVSAYKILKITSSSILWSEISTNLGMFSKDVPATKVSSITLDNSTLTIGVDESARLTPTILPSDADNKSVSWSCSDANTAMIVNGLVVAMAKGTTNIICSANDGSNKKAVCTLNVVDNPVTKLDLSETEINLIKGKYQTLVATITPSDADIQNISWESSDETVAIVDENGLVTAIAEGTSSITAKALGGHNILKICSVIVSPSINGHDYVDLDLPSGVLWATCNIGAEKPGDYGDYFAWGEIKTKIDYKNSLYAFWNGSSVSKYNVNSDYKTDLDYEDDVAQVNWGEKWRIPSRAQIEELIDPTYTTITWCTINDKQGMKVVSNSNGNSIFLPGSGYYDGTSLTDVNMCYYWTRDLYTANYCQGAKCFNYSTAGKSTTTSKSRWYGLSIRPVCFRK